MTVGDSFLYVQYETRSCEAKAPRQGRHLAMVGSSACAASCASWAAHRLLYFHRKRMMLISDTLLRLTEGGGFMYSASNKLLARADMTSYSNDR